MLSIDIGKQQALDFDLKVTQRVKSRKNATIFFIPEEVKGNFVVFTRIHERIVNLFCFNTTAI